MDILQDTNGDVEPEPLIIKNTEDLEIKEESFLAEYVADQDDFLETCNENGVKQETSENSCFKNVTTRRDAQRLRSRSQNSDNNIDLPNIRKIGRRAGGNTKNNKKLKVPLQNVKIEEDFDGEKNGKYNKMWQRRKTELKKRNSVLRQKLISKEKLKANTCKCCGKYFPDLKKHHLQKTRPEKFGCHFCAKKFEFQCGLKVHMEKIHANQKKTHRCADCGMCFNFQHKLQRHQLTHTEILAFECAECPKRFRRKDHLGAHMLTTHPKEFNYKCHQCEAAFKSKTKLTLHMETHEGGLKRLKCPHCPKTLTSRSGMKSHVVTHSSEKAFMCEKCAKTFFSKKELTRHMLMHTRARPFKCDFCERKFKCNVDVTKHQMRSSCRNKLLYKCNICKTGFTNDERRLEHEMAHMKRKTYKCTVKDCKKFFRTKEKLNSHWQLVHEPKPDIKPITVKMRAKDIKTPLHPQRKDGEPIVVLQRLHLGKAESRNSQPKWFKYYNGYCYFKKATFNDIFYWRCSEKYAKQCNATIGENMITGEKRKGRDHSHPPDPKMQLTVKIEEPTYDSEEEMESDVKPRIIEPTANGYFQAVKKKRVIYQCTYCKIIFKKKSILDSHRRLHTGEKPFVCPFCDKRFRASGSLITHKRLHTNERPFSCDECNYKAITSTNLNSHKLRNHVENRPTPHKCDLCPKAFTFGHDLTVHRRVHTNEKRYECLECKMCFSQHSGLKRHQSIHTNEKPHGCTECEFKSSRSSGLRRHKLVVHSKTNHFKCRNCSKKFKTMDVLKYHCFRTHHANADDFCEADYLVLPQGDDISSTSAEETTLQKEGQNVADLDLED